MGWLSSLPSPVHHTPMSGLSFSSVSQIQFAHWNLSSFRLGTYASICLPSFGAVSIGFHSLIASSICKASTITRTGLGSCQQRIGITTAIVSGDSWNRTRIGAIGSVILMSNSPFSASCSASARYAAFTPISTPPEPAQLPST